MRQCLCVLGIVLSAAGCAPSADVEQERESLLATDRASAQTATDVDKFVSYVAPEGTVYPQGMPAVRGTDAIRKEFSALTSAPGFSLTWTPDRAEIAGAGDIGYTTGTYEMTIGGAPDKGKYVTVWKKQADGEWKVMEDIFNSDGPPPGAAAQHVMVAPSAIKWGDPPPSLPPNARAAIISGDPAQAQPFVVRLQVPAGYRVAPHWHPTTENLTVLSGTVALGMGEKYDAAAMQNLTAGGFAVIPADMRHSFVARTAATFQVHGVGPFAVNYVNPADDPSKRNQTQ